MACLQTFTKSRDLFGEASRVEVPEEMNAILRRFLRDQLPKRAPHPFVFRSG